MRRTGSWRCSASTPTLQGRGIGAALLEVGHDACRSPMARPCFLETFTEPNVAYYQRHGYRADPGSTTIAERCPDPRDDAQATQRRVTDDHPRPRLQRRRPAAGDRDAARSTRRARRGRRPDARQRRLPLGPARRRRRVGAAIRRRPRPRGLRGRRRRSGPASRSGSPTSRPGAPRRPRLDGALRHLPRRAGAARPGSAPTGRARATVCATDLVRVHRDDGSPIGTYSGIGTFGSAQVVAAEAAIPDRSADAAARSPRSSAVP